jgi:hypothetical protein
MAKKKKPAPAPEPEKSERRKFGDAWIEWMNESVEQAIILDGFEECIVGMATRFGMEPVLAYDYNLCIEALMKQGMNYESAVEFFEFNTIGGWFGEGTPVFVNLKRPCE